MSACSLPRFGTLPSGSMKDNSSVVRFNSRMLSLSGCGMGSSVGVVGFCGRNIVLKPRPVNLSVNAASGPSGGGGSVAANGAIPGSAGTSLMVKRSGISVAVLRCVAGRVTMVSFLSARGPGIATLADHRIGDTSSALLDSRIPMTFAVMKAGGCSSPNGTPNRKLVSTLAGNLALNPNRLAR